MTSTLAPSTLAPSTPVPSRGIRLLTTANVVALLVVPQAVALALLAGGLLGGVVVASLACRRSGWSATRLAAAGWGLWVLGVIAAGAVLWLGSVMPSPF